MKVINKWNGKAYTVILDKGGTVTLQRSDGSIFEIAKAEFVKAYREVTDE